MVQEGNCPGQELEGEQKGRRETEREEGIGRRGSETGAETEYAMTISVVEKATAFSAGDNRACSDRGNREDKHSSCKRVGVPPR